MKIGSIQAERGQKAFGFFNTVKTHGEFSLDIPLHIVNGASEGPVLLVQAGVSGLEIEPSMTLPGLVKELDPAAMLGTLLLVPLLNTSGFEFQQRNAVWDNRDLNALGRGRPDGSPSEQMIHRYYEEVIARADAMLDIHTGALSGYYRYAGIYDGAAGNGSLDLARSLGLPQVLIGQPEDQSMAREAAGDGKQVVSVWLGGGPGLRDYHQDDARRLRNVILNALRHLGMLEGDIERVDGPTETLRAHTVIRLGGRRGLIFMDHEKRGAHVREGERLGYTRHSFTGETLEEIRAPRDGVLLHAGAVWPVVLDTEGDLLALLGDPVG